MILTTWFPPILGTQGNSVDWAYHSQDHKKWKAIAYAFTANTPSNDWSGSKIYNFIRVIGYIFFCYKQIAPWHKNFKIFWQGTENPSVLEINFLLLGILYLHILVLFLNI